MGLETSDHRFDMVLMKRCHLQNNVSINLHPYSSDSEKDHRAKLEIHLSSNDELNPCHPFFDKHSRKTLDSHKSVEGLFQMFFIFYPHFDSFFFRFMDHLWRNDLSD